MRAVISVRSGKLTVNSNDQPTPTIWFDTWRQLPGVASDENHTLLRLMREREPRTVMELAELSERTASNLSRTLRAMEGDGPVRLNRRVKTQSVPRSFGHRTLSGA